MTTNKPMLHFSSEDLSGSASLRADINTLIIAGWTGSNVQALEAHIKELELLGVARPRTTPIFYRGAASLLTQADEIQVVGNHSSGEVEPVVLNIDGCLWLGLGSDHTDRKVEAIGVTISKQMCAKPVGSQIWRFDTVAGHWDELVMRSWVTRKGQRELYQEGKLSSIRHPHELMRLRDADVHGLPQGAAMFCGTLAVHGEVAPADYFEMEIEDPVLGRRISHAYRAVALPIVD